MYIPENKEAVSSVRRLPQYCQFRDKFPVVFRGISGIFARDLKFLGHWLRRSQRLQIWGLNPNRNDVFTMESGLGLGTTKPVMQCVTKTPSPQGYAQLQRRESDLSSPSGTLAQNDLNYAATFLYLFLEWCLIKKRKILHVVYNMFRID